MTTTEFGHEQTTEDEEKLKAAADERDREAREAREKAERAEARELLARPVGGIVPDRAELQVTGGSKEIRPDRFPDKDDLLEVTIRGWVKHDQNVTVKRGENAKRVAVFVTDEIVGMRQIEPPQLSLADDEGGEPTEAEPVEEMSLAGASA